MDRFAHIVELNSSDDAVEENPAECVCLSVCLKDSWTHDSDHLCISRRLIQECYNRIQMELSEGPLNDIGSFLVPDAGSFEDTR
ncbi:unnamed protein product [Caenorhabditis nigoni]